MKQKKPTFNYKSGVVRINESLNKYDNVVLFPKKVEMAIEHLKRVGLPKEIEKQK